MYCLDDSAADTCRCPGWYIGTEGPERVEGRAGLLGV